ncbi:MAG: glycosyltransferase family 4 protein [Cytophagales bacterium]|nr:glycosyltransferase family 4 protein [Cytophagales bacterium]
MKILLVGPFITSRKSKNFGGISSHITELYDELKKEPTNQVDVLVTGLEQSSSVDNESSTFYGFDLTFGNLFKFLISFPGALLKSRFIHNGYLGVLKFFYYAFRVASVDLSKYDVIHIHGLHGAFALCFVGQKCKAKKILTIHSYHMYDPKVHVKRRFINHLNHVVNGMDHVIHVSAVDREKGLKLGLDLPPEKDGRHIYNGIYVPESINTPEFNKNVCYIGGLVSRKRVNLVIDAIIDTDMNLIICGDGSELRSKVQQAAQNRRNIKFQGQLDKEQIYNQLSDGSVLVVPSMSESFGIVYIEALIHGVPVIGYEHSINEFRDFLDVSSEESPLIVPFSPTNDNSEDLRQEILGIHEYRWSEKGRAAMVTLQFKAIEAFKWESIRGLVLDLYKKS